MIRGAAFAVLRGARCELIRYDRGIPADLRPSRRIAPLSSETALAELRSTTRAEHDRIEHILRLTEPMSMARYAAIVCGFDAFLGVWEPRIHAALPERLQGWFSTRRRAGFASADADWLRSEAGITPAPLSTALASSLPLVDLADVLGSLYVIEGSALGGRVIAPHLMSTLGLGQGHGASYFHGFGGQTGGMWADFRMIAAHEIGDSSESTLQACESARRTFAALIDLFAPLAAAAEAALEPAGVAQAIAPASSRAFEQDDAQPGNDPATRPL